MSSSYIGSRISLTDTKDVRFVGTLLDINTVESTVILSNVICYGTEDRVTSNPILPRNDLIQALKFHRDMIKDLTVIESATRPTTFDPSAFDPNLSQQQSPLFYPPTLPQHWNGLMYNMNPQLYWQQLSYQYAMQQLAQQPHLARHPPSSPYPPVTNLHPEMQQMMINSGFMPIASTMPQLGDNYDVPNQIDQTSPQLYNCLQVAEPQAIPSNDPTIPTKQTTFLNQNQNSNSNSNQNQNPKDSSQLSSLAQAMASTHLDPTPTPISSNSIQTELDPITPSKSVHIPFRRVGTPNSSGLTTSISTPHDRSNRKQLSNHDPSPWNNLYSPSTHSHPNDLSLRSKPNSNQILHPYLKKLGEASTGNSGLTINHDQVTQGRLKYSTQSYQPHSFSKENPSIGHRSNPTLPLTSDSTRLASTSTIPSQSSLLQSKSSRFKPSNIKTLKSKGYDVERGNRKFDKQSFIQGINESQSQSQSHEIDPQDTFYDTFSSSFESESNKDHKEGGGGSLFDERKTNIQTFGSISFHMDQRSNHYNRHPHVNYNQYHSNQNNNNPSVHSNRYQHIKRDHNNTLSDKVTKSNTNSSLRTNPGHTVQSNKSNSSSQQTIKPRGYQPKSSSHGVFRPKPLSVNV